MANTGKKGEASRGKKRRFSEAFKREAVQLLRERQRQQRSAAEVARELGIAPSLLSEWVRHVEETLNERGESPTGETLEEEVRRLRRENAVLKQEREFAKKAAAFFAKESL